MYLLFGRVSVVRCTTVYTNGSIVQIERFWVWSSRSKCGGWELEQMEGRITYCGKSDTVH
jgi:hypothetical protein